MLRSYRGIVAALVGLAWVLSFYFIVDDLGSVSRQAEANASDRAEEYREDAERYVERRCLGLAVPAAEDCARQAYQAARENQRIEQDLAAQRGMAWWTQIMGVAALMAMAISTVGVWLVWTTFRETKRTADAAIQANDNARDALAHTKEMAEIELRPYLHVEEISFQAADSLEALRSVLVRVRNFGSTPATRFRIEAAIDVRNTVKINKKKGIPTRPCPSVDEIPPGHSTTISIPGVPRGAFLGEGIAYFCTIRFHYSDRFGAEHTRWETYRSETRGKGEFRFFSHNHS